MNRDALAALFYLTAAAVIIAGAISLAVSAEPVEAPKPPYLLEAGHPSRCYSQWLRRTPTAGYYRTWYDDAQGRTWWLRDRFYTRAATPGDRY